MSRESGDRYHCDSCGDNMVHSEICCGKQMTKIEGRTSGPSRSTISDY